MTWVVARESHGTTFFWTGDTTDYGFPIRTTKPYEAKGFDVYGDASDARDRNAWMKNWSVRLV